MRSIKMLAAAVLAVGGSVLMLWLAFTNVALAWLSLVTFAVLAIGGIVFAAWRTLRNPWTGVVKANPSFIEPPARRSRRVAP